MNQYNYIDIFAGCGGLSLGLHQSGWSGVFAIEKNKDAFNTLKTNLIDGKKHFSWVDWLPMEANDINSVLSKYKKQLSVLSSTVSLIVGGPPCQGFSMAGQRKQDDIRNTLVDSYIKFIEIVKPNFLFFENVHGITVGFTQNNIKNTPTSAYIIDKLQKIGYNVSYRILDLSEFGIPQKRKRFILIGSLHSDPDRFFLILNEQKYSFAKTKKIPLTNTVSDAISDLLATEPINCPDSRGFMSSKYNKPLSKYQKLMRVSLTNTSSVPNSHRFANHKKDTIDLFLYLKVHYPVGKRLSTKNIQLPNFKRRGLTILDPHQPCNTITSHPDDYIHYHEPRILTVRECARIQSFPDWYIFTGKYTTGGEMRKTDVPRYTQVGNAIPPLFAEQVGLALKKLMEEE